jgi:putative transposase
MADDRNDNEMEAPFAVKRARIDVHIGAYYQCHGKIYQIDSPSSDTSVIGIDVETNLPTTLAIAELKPILESSLASGTSGIGNPSIGDKRWNEGLKKFEVIRPFINDPSPGAKVVEKAAETAGVDSSSIYRWLRKYRLHRDISCLCPEPRGWKKGNSRLNEDQDHAINRVINDYYLKPQRPSVLSTIQKVEEECYLKGIKIPGASAIRSRIAQISERRKLRKRGQKKQADAKFLATPGHYPETSHPFEVVQIDHTFIDLSAVDEDHRLDIGRFWGTFAIDVHTRALVGLYLSLDAPSQTSVAMCMASMLTPKAKSFREKGIYADLPFHGIPGRLHLDNGPEFHGDSFTRSCGKYGIEVSYRPVQVPRYGAHIERLIGTFMQKTHSLPGTTFSSIKEKGEYDSSKYAALTLAEYEKWLLIEICKIYHVKHHSGIGMSPTEKWRRFYLTATSKGQPLTPPRPVDDKTVLIDFLPIFDRTVQNNGVTIDDITYYDDVLRGYIGATDPDDSKKKQFFEFRRDPRDISKIWFFDPSEASYFPILASSQPFPDCSIWEWNKVKKALAAENPKEAVKEEIIKARLEQGAIVEASIAKTKKQRRENQRKRQHNEIRRIQKEQAPISMPAVASSLIEDSELDDVVREGFDDIS